MIYKRFAARLKAQDWLAITIELGIVVLGVFIGNWVNDWNQNRAAKREAQALIYRIRPQLELLDKTEPGEKTYYATTRRYAEVALAAWAGDRRVSDRDFVIAAYQASQITGLPIEGQVMNEVLGGDEVRKVDDPALRDALTRVMTFNYSQVGADAVQSDYRRHVRELLPDPIQRAVRAQCGDKQELYWLSLPARCDIAIAPDLAAKGAARLRAHPELADQLAFHLALTDNFLGNLGRFEIRVRNLIALMDGKKGYWE